MNGQRESGRSLRGLAVLAAVLAAALALRMTGPSDLYDNDQPKTIAYTADIVHHGQWILPHENMRRSAQRAHEGRPATKPPMYNWIGAAAVMTIGRWDEWVLKLPSLLGGIIVLGAIGFAGPWLMRRADEAQRPPQDTRAVGFGVLGALIWLACYATAKLIYTARPDMVLTAFMTLGWLAATVLLKSDEPMPVAHRIAWQLLLWTATAGAALTKGVPAVVIVIFIVLGAKWIAGRWSAAGRTGIAWGGPLAAAAFGVWAWAVYRADAQHFMDVLIGEEVAQRVGGRGVWHLLRGVGVMPLNYLHVFAPWSVIVVLALAHMKPGKWFGHVLGPVFLWVLVMVVVFSFSGSTRADYIAPALPASAIAAAWWLVVVARKYAMTTGRAAMAAVAVALGMFAYSGWFTDAGRSCLGEHVHEFAQQIRQRVGDDQAIVFIDTGYNPLQTLLGRHQTGDPTSQQIAEADWLIIPMAQVLDRQPVITSQPIPEVIGADGQRATLPLGLFPNR